MTVFTATWFFLPDVHLLYVLTYLMVSKHVPLTFSEVLFVVCSLYLILPHALMFSRIVLHVCRIINLHSSLYVFTVGISLCDVCL